MSNAKIRERAKQDLTYFVREVMPYGGGERAGGHAGLDSPMHQEMCCFLEGLFTEKQPISVLLAPRFHGKTLIASVSHTLWRIIRNPEITILFIHGTEALALDVGAKIWDHCVSNEILRELFCEPHGPLWLDPLKQAPEWNANAMTFKRKSLAGSPTIRISAYGKAKTGSHSDLIVLDDIVNKETAASEVMIEKCRMFVRTLAPLVNNARSRILDIGTRWDKWDAHGMLLNKEEEFYSSGYVRDFVKSCWADEARTVPIWPSGADLEFLKFQRVAMGRELFAANMLNDPVPEGATFFKASDVQRWVPEWDPIKKQVVLPDRKLNVYISVDPNCQEKEHGDPACVMVAAHTSKGELFVLDMMHGHPSMSELIEWIVDLNRKWRPLRVFIEAVAFQRVLIQALDRVQVERGESIPKAEVVRPPQAAKSTRIRGLVPTVEAKRLYVPTGDRFEPLMREIDYYTHKTKKRDDCLDALADIFHEGSAPPYDGLCTAPHRHAILSAMLQDQERRRERGGVSRVRSVEHGYRRYR